MKTPFKPLGLVVNIHTGEVEMVDKVKPGSFNFNAHYTYLYMVGGIVRWDKDYRLLSPKEVLINLDVKPKK